MDSHGTDPSWEPSPCAEMRAGRVSVHGLVGSRQLKASAGPYRKGSTGISTDGRNRHGTTFVMMESKSASAPMMFASIAPLESLCRIPRLHSLQGSRLHSKQGHRNLPGHGADLEAAASGGVADGQLGGAAVRLVVAAGGLGQRAARPREAVPEEVAQAAARGACTVRRRFSGRAFCWEWRMEQTETQRRCRYSQSD